MLSPPSLPRTSRSTLYTAIPGHWWLLPQPHTNWLASSFILVTTRQEFDDSRFAADQLRHQKRQELKLRARATTMGFELVPLLQAG